MAFHLRKEGMSLAQIGCSAPMIGPVVRAGRHTSGVPEEWESRSGRLTVLEREQILISLGHGDSIAAIARRLGRSASTVSREVNSNGGKAGIGRGSRIDERGRRHDSRSLSN